MELAKQPFLQVFPLSDLGKEPLFCSRNPFYLGGYLWGYLGGYLGGQEKTRVFRGLSGLPWRAGTDSNRRPRVSKTRALSS